MAKPGCPWGVPLRYTGCHVTCTSPSFRSGSSYVPQPASFIRSSLVPFHQVRNNHQVFKINYPLSLISHPASRIPHPVSRIPNCSPGSIPLIRHFFISAGFGPHAANIVVLALPAIACVTGLRWHKTHAHTTQ